MAKKSRGRPRKAEKTGAQETPQKEEETMFGMSPVWVRAIGLVGVVALAAVIFFAARWMRYRVWRNRFVKAFGFAPEAWPRRAFQQPEVDAELKRLAKAFAASVEKENNTLGPYLDGTNYRGTGLRDLEEYKSIHQELLAAKKEFWAAHKVAARAGFFVKEKHTDYL